jgi:predicted RNA binding protein YcfA (HicA-like mRNA interferase family)
MKLPRDLSGRQLVQLLTRLGYRVERQTASHIRLASPGPAVQHLTIPDHAALKVGTLNAILRLVGEQTGITRPELIQRLFEQ